MNRSEDLIAIGSADIAILNEEILGILGELRGCDTEVRTGTSGTGAVRTQYVHTPGPPVTHPPGFVSCSFTCSCFTFSRPHIYCVAL